MKMQQSDTYSWHGLVKLAEHAQILEPKSILEVQQILREAKGTRFRVIGNGLSFEPIVQVFQQQHQAKLLNLKHLTEIGPISDDLVSVGAATNVQLIFDTLAAKGKMLEAAPGVIGLQTIAGAISTCTHGQGLHQSGLSDSVQSLQVVAADGSLLKIDRGDERFGAFIGSLGCLGVIVSLSLRIKPLEIITCLKQSVLKDEFLHSYVAWNRDHLYCKAWWFPETNLVHVWRADLASEDELERYRTEGESKLMTLGDLPDKSMNSSIESISKLMEQDTRDYDHAGRQFETVNRFKDAKSVVGNVYQVFCNGIPVPQINCELAVPLTRFDELVETLDKWYKRTKFHLHYPFIFRCTGPSDAWLSPAYKQETCYVGFVVYLAADGSAAPGSYEMMRSLQEALIPLGALPHLGKHYTMDMYDFRKRLQRFDEFDRLRKVLDPQGMFENDFIRELCLPADTEGKDGHAVSAFAKLGPKAEKENGVTIITKNAPRIDLRKGAGDTAK